MDVASLLQRFIQRKPGIVVVDDNRDLLRLYSRTLRRAGFGVEARTHPHDLMALASRPGVSAVILDLVLPGRSGLDVLMQLRADPRTRHLPVFMLTGEDSVYRFSEAMARGAAAYMTKPVPPDRLVALVRQGLRSHTSPALLLSRA